MLICQQVRIKPVAPLSPFPFFPSAPPAAISTLPSTEKAQLCCPLLDPNSSLWDIDFFEMPFTVTLVEAPQKILLTSCVMSDIIKHTNSFIWMCSLFHNCHIFSCIVYIPGFSNQIVMSLRLVPSPLVVSAALHNSWPKETLSDVFVVLRVLFTWLSSQIFLIDSLIAARVVFSKWC